MSCRPKAGFTLVELLVVITIIGILIGLLLPAVQAARESGRRANCLNNVRQIAVAMISHENQYGHFPTGGWGNQWMGDPDRGAGKQQPGGWMYNILPFVGEEVTYELMKTEPLVAIANSRRIFHCPSRRAPETFPSPSGVSFVNITPSSVTDFARSDYAANAGTSSVHEDAGPDDAKESTLQKYPWTSDTGICFQRSTVEDGHIKDGLSNTYLVGEKYLCVKYYKVPGSSGDDSSMYAGFDADTLRWGTSFPEKDHLDTEPVKFGSVHANGWHVALCDSSIHMVDFGIDATVHRRLANRKDGKPVDTTLLRN